MVALIDRNAIDFIPITHFRADHSRELPFFMLDAQFLQGVLVRLQSLVSTIRKDFAESIEANSVHGSDSTENAEREIAFFFRKAKSLFETVQELATIASSWGTA